MSLELESEALMNGKLKVIVMLMAALGSVCRSTVATALVSYPSCESYQARSYERNAAECLARFGPAEACARLLETAIGFDPDQASSHHALGWLYYLSEDRALALAEFANALRLDPTMTDVLRAMGDIYASQGKLTLAEEKYRQYLEAVPDDPMGNYGLGAVFALRGDRDGAIEQLGQAVSKGFSNFELLNGDPKWEGMKNDPEILRLQGGAVPGG